MNLPPPVVQGVEPALEATLGRPVTVTRGIPVGGGCINPSARLEVDTGEWFFLKWNSSSPPEMFEAEAEGLRALARPGTLRVPEVMGWGGSGTSQDPAWLLLEFVPSGRPGPRFGQFLGEGLGAIHNQPGTETDPATPPRYGWHRANFIGSLPQENPPTEDWTTFWRKARLEPQLRMARERGYFKGGSGRVMDSLLDGLDAVMEGADLQGPALLHGDLWSGNFYAGGDGTPVLIDPAVYRGVGEVDLAMMELFGSLPRGFMEGYRSRRTPDPEYDRFRRDLYQLYYLLVHVNLFGGGYLGGTLAAAERALQGM